jgi:aminocarboxymuconate-semialdehyde decarboxylase
VAVTFNPLGAEGDQPVELSTDLLDYIHAHVIPGSFPAVPSGCDPASWPSMSDAADGTRLLVSGTVRFTAQQAWFDAERRLAASAGGGVDAEVVSPFPPLLNYRLPAEVILVT